jgi:aminoglycoside 3-N-acetyltransferase
MGVIAETFRRQNGVVRSGHPHSSFAAWGKHRDYIIQDNHFDNSQNMASPLGRVYELNGHVLLLGVDHDSNTSLHLAEYLADCPRKNIVEGFPVIEDGRRQWKYFENILYDSDDFIDIGRAFAESGGVKTSKIGSADAHLMNQPQLVDFATSWMSRHRNGSAE